MVLPPELHGEDFIGPVLWALAALQFGFTALLAVIVWRRGGFRGDRARSAEAEAARRLEDDSDGERP